MNNGETPAFPAAESEHTRFSFGLTKREYFAALAMQGILSNREMQIAIYKDQKIDGTTGLNAIAFHAVKEADQLLKQLESCETK